MTLIRIREVTPLDGLRLRLRLTNDAVIERDVSELMHGPIFEPLRKDPALFRDVRIEAGTVVWETAPTCVPTSSSGAVLSQQVLTPLPLLRACQCNPLLGNRLDFGPPTCKSIGYTEITARYFPVYA